MIMFVINITVWKAKIPVPEHIQMLIKSDLDLGIISLMSITLLILHTHITLLIFFFLEKFHIIMAGWNNCLCLCTEWRVAKSAPISVSIRTD